MFVERIVVRFPIRSQSKKYTPKQTQPKSKKRGGERRLCATVGLRTQEDCALPRWHLWGIERIGGYRRIKQRCLKMLTSALVGAVRCALSARPIGTKASPQRDLRSAESQLQWKHLPASIIPLKPLHFSNPQAAYRAKREIACMVADALSEISPLSKIPPKLLRCRQSLIRKELREQTESKAHKRRVQKDCGLRSGFGHKEPALRRGGIVGASNA